MNTSLKFSKQLKEAGFEGESRYYWDNMSFNRNNSILVVHNNKFKTLSEVCRLTNRNYNTIYYRIKKLGMTPLEAFNKINRYKNPKKK